MRLSYSDIMSLSNNKDILTLLAYAKGQGWSVRRMAAALKQSKTTVARLLEQLKVAEGQRRAG